MTEPLTEYDQSSSRVQSFPSSHWRIGSVLIESDMIFLAVGEHLPKACSKVFDFGEPFPVPVVGDFLEDVYGVLSHGDSGGVLLGLHFARRPHKGGS